MEIEKIPLPLMNGEANSRRIIYSHEQGFRFRYIQLPGIKYLKVCKNFTFVHLNACNFSTNYCIGIIVHAVFINIFNVCHQVKLLAKCYICVPQTWFQVNF